MDKNVFYEYGKKTAQCFGISTFLVLLIEILARHSLLKGFSYVWNHPFLVLYSALILTSVFSLASLSKKRDFWLLFSTCLTLLLGVVNFILLFFRITPLSAADFSLLASVMDIMEIYLTPWQIALLILLLVFVLFACIWFGCKIKAKERNICVAGIISALLFFMTGLLMNIGDATGMLQTEFGNMPDAYDANGFVYCFTRSLVDRGIEKPEEYSEDVVENIFDAVKGLGDKSVAHRPNIIFIQLESMFDIHRVKDARYSENPIPVYQSLLENCPTGALYVPSVGAGTANTEFEVLTGMSLDYFGAGEYPYQTVLQEETCESVAYNLKRLGYYATAIHNNTGNFYDRNRVYANLGFDCFDSEEYMYGLTYNSIGWAKDRILTQEIMEVLKVSPKQDFIYTVSVQPHGKYPEEKLENPHLTVSGFSLENEERANAFEFYINELHETDAFLGSLISALNAFDEPTVVVMFGDHLPNIEMEQTELVDEQVFQTEYLIWTNQAQKEKYILHETKKDLYAYQLYAYVLGRLGMNPGVLPKFHQRYSMEKIHEEELETLQYDMLYGEKEVFNNINPYKRTHIKMGIKDITILGIECVGESLYVQGDNFTEFSKVMVDNKEQETVYLNRNTLMVQDFIPKDGTMISVAQVPETGKALSYSNEIRYKE